MALSRRGKVDFSPKRLDPDLCTKIAPRCQTLTQTSRSLRNFLDTILAGTHHGDGVGSPHSRSLERRRRKAESEPTARERSRRFSCDKLRPTRNQASEAIVSTRSTPA